MDRERGEGREGRRKRRKLEGRRAEWKEGKKRMLTKLSYDTTSLNFLFMK